MISVEGLGCGWRWVKSSSRPSTGRGRGGSNDQQMYNGLTRSTPGGSADDGKRSHALDVVLALLLGEKFQIGEGSGEGWARDRTGNPGWRIYRKVQ